VRRVAPPRLTLPTACRSWSIVRPASCAIRGADLARRQDPGGGAVWSPVWRWPPRAAAGWRQLAAAGREARLAQPSCEVAPSPQDPSVLPVLASEGVRPNTERLLPDDVPFGPPPTRQGAGVRERRNRTPAPRWVMVPVKARGCAGRGATISCRLNRWQPEPRPAWMRQPPQQTRTGAMGASWVRRRRRDQPPGPWVGAAGRPLARSGGSVPTRVEHLDAQVDPACVPPPCWSSCWRAAVLTARPDLAA
jgi:hypothetical protein